MLGGRRLRRQLVQAQGHEGSDDCKVSVWVGNHLRQVSYDLVIQALDPHSTFNHGSRVHHAVVGLARPNTDHAIPEGGHRPRDQ